MTRVLVIIFFLVAILFALALVLRDTSGALSDKNNKEWSPKGVNESVANLVAPSFRSEGDSGVYDGPIDLPIDENEIFSGGPGKDGIPSIDDPLFESVSETAFLENDDPGIVLNTKDGGKFYPFDILAWHEIVNDTIALNSDPNGLPVAVTYCPLCRTGVVYERRVNGAVVEFGVSGKLWQSNLLMYNRTDNLARESLWSQVLGAAVTGAHTGITLSIVPSDIITFENFKRAYPRGQVLTRDTGFTRPYGQDPYEGYDTSERVAFPAEYSDALFSKTYVVGVEIDGASRAYPLADVPVGTTEDVVGETPVTISKNEYDEVVIVRTDTNEQVTFVGAYWFSWASVNPQTTVWEAS